MDADRATGLAAAVAQHVTELDGDRVARDRTTRVPRALLARAAEAGLTGVILDEIDGGAGASHASAASAYELLGRADAAYAFMLSTHNAVTASVARHAEPAVRRAWLPRLIRADALGAFCMTEPGAGSDAGGLRTRLVTDGPAFRLHGQKAWVSLIGEAALLLVVCRTGDGRGKDDMAIVVVPADRAGLTVAGRYSTMGAPFLPIGDLDFDGVLVRADEVLVAPGRGLQAALAAIDVARVNVAAIAVGVATLARDLALDYAARRALATETVLDQQAIRFALADIETSIVAGRALYHAAADALGTPAGRVLAAHAKRFCPDGALAAAITSSGVLGANGWRLESRFPRLIADARMLQSVDGTPEIQRHVIARSLTSPP